MSKISIVIPTFNEQESLGFLYTELVKLMESLNKYDWEVIFVNDGSTDETLVKIKQLRNKDIRVSYLDLSRNFGKEAALCAGFDYASGNCVIIMDADLQHPPRAIIEMISYWEQGFDDVYAKRSSRGKENWLRKRLSLMYYSILKKVSNVEVIPNVGDFRLLDRNCINVLKTLRENERYTKGLYTWIGFRKKAIEFEQADRIAGSSAWTYRKLLKLAIDGITSHSVAPLRISAFVGVIVSGLSFIYMLYVLTKTIILGESVPGYPTLILTILFLGGLQLISLGVLGEYIGHIFNETKNRPPYIAREFNGQDIHKNN